MPKYNFEAKAKVKDAVAKEKSVKTERVKLLAMAARKKAKK